LNKSFTTLFFTELFILVPVFSELLLPFMGGDLLEFALSSAGHYRLLVKKYIPYQGISKVWNMF
jgi:hypothetical protein